MSGATDDIPAGANRLAMLAAAIRDADARCRRSAAETATAAIECGNWLREAKAAVAHGQWLPWLRENTGLTAREAQRFMRVAASGLEMREVAHLSAAAADRALRKRITRHNAETEAFLDQQAAKIREHMAHIKAEAVRLRAEFAAVYAKHGRDAPPCALLDDMERVDEPGGMDRLVDRMARALELGGWTPERIAEEPWSAQAAAAAGSAA